MFVGFCFSFIIDLKNASLELLWISPISTHRRSANFGDDSLREVEQGQLVSLGLELGYEAGDAAFVQLKGQQAFDLPLLKNGCLIFT